MSTGWRFTLVAIDVAAMFVASLMALAWIALVAVACGLSVDPGFLGANQPGQGPLLAHLLAIGLPVIVAAGMLTSEVLLLPLRL